MSTDFTTLTIEINYWHSKAGDPTTRVNSNYYTNTFDIKILPLAKLVQTCVTEGKMTVASSVANQSYTIAAAAITITPPTFALTSPTATIYSNTALPISYLEHYTKLEY